MITEAGVAGAEFGRVGVDIPVMITSSSCEEDDSFLLTTVVDDKSVDDDGADLISEYGRLDGVEGLGSDDDGDRSNVLIMEVKD